MLISHRSRRPKASFRKIVFNASYDPNSYLYYLAMAIAGLLSLTKTIKNIFVNWKILN